MEVHEGGVWLPWLDCPANPGVSNESGRPSHIARRFCAPSQTAAGRFSSSRPTSSDNCWHEGVDDTEHNNAVALREYLEVGAVNERDRTVADELHDLTVIEEPWLDRTVTCVRHHPTPLGCLKPPHPVPCRHGRHSRAGA
jgi:hypothetical protein